MPALPSLPMMFPAIAASIWAAYRLRDHDLFIPSVAVAIVTFVSYGILNNYRDDPVWVDRGIQATASVVSLLGTLATIGLLIVSFADA